jgi:hypothetical protein
MGKRVARCEMMTSNARHYYYYGQKKATKDGNARAVTPA